MVRTILARPFFVFALSVLTLLLLWQDVSAQRTATSPTGPRTTDSANPVATPGEAKPAQGQGTGTVTIDGETQSFTVARCSPYIMDSRGMKRVSVDLTTTAETGSLFFLFHQDVYDEARRGGTVRGEDFDIVGQQRVNLRPAGHNFEGQRMKTTSGAWEYPPESVSSRPASRTGDEPAPGPSFQIDGSSVTASGTFRSRITGTDHVVEFRVEGITCIPSGTTSLAANPVGAPAAAVPEAEPPASTQSELLTPNCDAPAVGTEIRCCREPQRYCARFGYSMPLASQ